MKLAKFWARGKGGSTGPDGYIEVVARGWSDESFDAARACAVSVARRVAERLIANPAERNHYQYGDRPLPEPLIRQFDLSSVVTRNVYGALVLNVDHLMFVDIDRENALEPIRRVAEGHGLSARVYRTAAGFRVMIPHVRSKPDTNDSNQLMTEFGSDPLYMHLCRSQGSFRARLTPKPWRCGFRKPPVEFPFDTPQSAMQFQQWEAEYNRHAARYATCHYEVTFGGVRILPEFEALIEYHDQETRANSAAPLA
jgi:hypothetical protein